MTQQKLDNLQGMGRLIVTWAGIFGILASLVLGWDQIGRNKKDNTAQQVKIEANSSYVIEDKTLRMQIRKDLNEVKADVKTLLKR